MANRPRSPWLVPASLIALAFIPTLAGVLRLIGLARGVAMLDGHERFAADPVPAVLHIVGATGFVLIGALQFSVGLRRRHPRWHRAIGTALAPLGIIAALSAIWMTLRWPSAPYDGAALETMRLAVGSAMSAFIVVALLALRRRDYVAHGWWMTRAYALGSAAGTQALLFMAWFLVALVPTATGNAAIMGAGWMLNIVIAEVAIHRRTRRGGVPPRGETMRALLHHRYGGPELLQVARVPRPTPSTGQVLVRVRAASLNAMEYRIMRADPFLVRLQNGLFRPRRPILGADFAGVVEAVGPDVTDLSAGDEVFGEVFFADGLGAFAEYVCVRKEGVVRRPAQIGVVEAAALPLASITALQAVRDRAKVREGQSVLVYGAGGGVGAFIVQIAKAYGARVTAVCGPGSKDLVASFGADHVLDYTRDGLTNDDHGYDAIFGVNGYRPLADYRSRLSAHGVYVVIGGTGRQIFEGLFGKIRFGRGRRRVDLLMVDESRHTTDLAEVRDLALSGRLRAPIDRVFSLARGADAIRYAESGHVRGKVVLAVA